MSPYYNQNYTREQIAVVLRSIHNCIKDNRFVIAKNTNRQENMDFINEYNLTSKRQKEILLKIELEDFCYTLKNTKPGFEQEVLYVFCPQVDMIDFEGDEKVIDIYTKFNLIELAYEKQVVVISFHKRNKPIDYCFKK